MGSGRGGRAAGQRGISSADSHSSHITSATVSEVLLPGPIPRFEVPGWQERYGVIAGITGRGNEAGRGFDLGLWSREPVGDVMNRWLAFRRAMPGFSAVVLGNQVHGVEVREVGPAEGWIQIQGVDGWVSASPGVMLTITVADCVPVYLAVANRAVALLHAGWRGTLQYIVAKAAASLQECYDSQPAELIAAIGPSASCDVYEVGPEVIEQFTKADPSTAKYFASTKDDHATIDLPSINREQLISAGLRPENISIAPLCTMSRTDLFFSYRIEKKTYGNGRMLSVIGRSRPASSNDVPHVPNA